MRRQPARGVVVSLGLLVAGCGLLGDPDAVLPIEDVRTTGRELPGTLAGNPTGPHVEILTGTVGGEDIEVVAQRDGPGICLAVRRAPEGSTGCGPLPDADPIGRGFGMLLPAGLPPEDGSAPPLQVAGLLSAEVSAVVIELVDGRDARALLFSLAPAEVEGSGFVAYLPADEVGWSVVALSSDGSELGRLEYASGH